MENREIISLHEIERRRIAEELHDTTVQDMIYLSQQLQLACLYMEKDIVQAKLEIITAKKQIKDIINGIRDTIYDLRPMNFYDISWDAAVNHLFDELSKNDMCVRFDIDSLDISDGVTAISVYRIISEACRNTIKHSRAKNLIVSVKNKNDFIYISIVDDGIGFDSKIKSNHFGLQFIKDRVALLSGNIDIESNSNGTCIKIGIPY